MIKTLNEAQARELLASARIARLGCIVNEEPYVTPINYDVEGDCVYSLGRIRERDTSGLRT